MFLERIKEAPLPASAEAAAGALTAWREAAERSGGPALGERAAALAGTPGGRALLEGIFGSSPHVGRLLQAEPDVACALFERGPDAVFAEIVAELDRAARLPQPTAALMRGLRIGKRRAALAVAIADLTGAWELERITGALSDLAELAIDCAVAHLLRELADAGRIALAGRDDPNPGSGVFVLGMGKLGARELNYSSDIDLMIFYDEDRVRTTQPERLGQSFVRLARSLLLLLQERTADGYVFRTDLRLRPDPASTPLAMSAHTAEVYYESMGQNWERAAMIKARAVAGDRAAGAAFLRYLRPFVWRRNLDFGAIRDIHSIKRQINANRGGGTIAVGGHNVKLGRGGIREIEFYAQTQQLIWGGRDPSLRVRGTCEALARLAEAGHITAAARDELTEAYRYLRRVEHRLQMIADEQTHTLPETARLGPIARFLGYEDAATFAAELRRRLERVERHYAALFEEEAPLGGPGNLVFTGTEDDPETIETLRGMGYRDPSAVAAMVRGWHHGRVRPTRSVRARELLTELMPRLLQAFAETADPDYALRKLDGFLHRLPAGVQLFSLFQANPALLGLLAEIMGGSPLLAERLSRQPIVLDAVLTEDFFAPPPDAAAMAGELDEAFAQAADLQDALDVARRWANDRKFQVGVQMLRGSLDPLAACRVLSDVADAVIARLQTAVEEEFAQAHGRFPGGGMAVIAFGKLGSRELTLTSDLDMVPVYDLPEGVERSDGARPLAPSTYFIRLTQRLMTAITAMTGEGKLYEVDLRLRPSGNDGPLAAHVCGFETYEREAAWTWEHMALTRARVVTGPPGLRARIEALRDEVVGRSREPAALARDVAEMRERMRRTKPARSDWDLGNRRGGLVDLEFAAQFLVLMHARAHPEVREGDTAATFRRLGAVGCLDPGAAADLAGATELFRRLQHMLRLTGDGAFDEAAAGPWLEQLLARVAGAVDFPDLKAKIGAAAERAARLYDELVAAPAVERDPADGAGG